MKKGNRMKAQKDNKTMAAMVASEAKAGPQKSGSSKLGGRRKPPVTPKHGHPSGVRAQRRSVMY